jgi:hypothetical protein
MKTLYTRRSARLYSVLLAAAVPALQYLPAADSGTNSPGPTPGFLLKESADFRRTLFGRDLIARAEREGAICLALPEFSVTGHVELRSTNQWYTVAAVLGAALRNPVARRPQVRIIQKNRITQSDLALSDVNTKRNEFLNTKLFPGDVVVVARRVD